MTLHDARLETSLATALHSFLMATVSSPPSELVADHFADPMVMGDLSGAGSVPRAILTHAITQRAALMASAGHAGTDLCEWEALPLGPGTALVSARWRLRFAPVGGTDAAVDLVSDYLIDLTGGAPRCLAYTTRQNVMESLAAVGIAFDAPPPAA